MNEPSTDLLTGMDLTFERNLGQADPEAAFVGRSSSWRICLVPGGMRFDLRGTPGATSYLRVRGARPGVVPRGGKLLDGKSHYFLGRDPKKWIRNVPHHSDVVTQGVLPGVDLRWRGLPGGKVRYDFECSRAADADALVLEAVGVESLRVDEVGRLVVSTKAGVMRHSAPEAWQESRGVRRPVGCSFVVEGREIRFRLEGADPALPLVIDPTVEVSTPFAPGSGAIAQGAAIDDQGRVLLAGRILGSGWGTATAYQGSLAGDWDAFVARFPAGGGTAFSYFTYLGGKGTDHCFDLDLDTSGRPCVGGQTTSDDFPLVNPVRSSCQSEEGYVAVLGPDGDRLDFSTYFGGSGDDSISAVIPVAGGKYWVGGMTYSSDLSLVSAFDSSLESTTADGFLALLDPSGNGVLFSSYLGGGAHDAVSDICLGSSGTLWATGYSYSNDFPTANALDGSFGGAYDAFLTGVSTVDYSIEYSSYIGGVGNDSGVAVATGPTGFVHVVGTTTSSDFPVVSAFQSSGGSGYDGFLYVFDPIEEEVKYSTYFGGTSSDHPRGAAVDLEGNTYITGICTGNLPTVNPTDGTANGEFEMFMAVVKADGSAVTFSTYHGGPHMDSAWTLATNGAVAVMAGDTTSVDFPRVNGLDQTFTSGTAGALVVIRFAADPMRNLAAAPASATGIDLSWTDPNGGVHAVQVQRREVAGSFADRASLAAGTTTWADTGLLENHPYEYRVRGTSGGGNSAWSLTAQGRTLLLAPEGVVAAAAGNDEVLVSWTDSSTAETGYLVLRRSDGTGAFLQAASLPPGTTEWSDTTVSAETPYEYRVRTLGADGVVADSAPAAVNTPPADPTGFSVQVVHDERLDLSWNDVSGAETGYRLERRDDDAGGEFELLVSTGANVDSCTDEDVSPEHGYSYRLRAENGDGTSRWSEVQSAITAPGAPSGLVATALSPESIGLQWVDNSATEGVFRVERKGPDDVAYTLVGDLGAGTTSHVDDGLLQEQAYTYRVSARTSNRSSRFSESESTESPAQLLVAKASLKGARGGKPSRLTVQGSFDVGTSGVDLNGPASLGIGGAVLSIPGFSPQKKGALLRHEGEGMVLDLMPSRSGGSGVGFRLVLDGGESDVLDPDGWLPLSFETGEFRAMGNVRLLGGIHDSKKRIGERGTPSLGLEAFKAAIGKPGKHTLGLKGTFAPPEVPWVAPPDIRIVIGDGFEATLLGVEFTEKGGRYLLKTGSGTTWKGILDPSRGTLTLKASSADLGVFTPGPVALRILLELGGLSYSDEPVIVTDGRSLVWSPGK